jgi:UDP-N-acetylglucosamine--N-acetylmuramyl-(pentapeptide) pyrophosphoryl-undecaprenol N-acetylglucosamine transferase
MTVRILLAGGGTGGHLFPALAVADELQQRGAEVLFVGTRAGIEATLLPEKGYPLAYLWLAGFKRKRILANLLLPLKVLVSLVQSLLILLRYRPHSALGTGGYACGPVLLVAALLRVPLYLQEQNSFPGVTTRMLTKFAVEVFLNFDEAASFLPRKVKWRHVGNPVRSGCSRVDRDNSQKRWGLNPALPTLLVFGGSQGAARINKAVHASLANLGSICNLIWSRGRSDPGEISRWQGPGVLVVEQFIDDMPAAYAAADLAVCRSGAMTLSELQAAGLPAILIPFPHAAGDHQRHNARAYADRGGAIVIEDRQMDGDRLIDEVSALFDQREKLDQMRQALGERPLENTAAIIADELLRGVEEGVEA